MHEKWSWFNQMRKYDKKHWVCESKGGQQPEIKSHTSSFFLVWCAQPFFFKYILSFLCSLVFFSSCTFFHLTGFYFHLFFITAFRLFWLPFFLAIVVFTVSCSFGCFFVSVFAFDCILCVELVLRQFFRPNSPSYQMKSSPLCIIGMDCSSEQHLESFFFGQKWRRWAP